MGTTISKTIIRITVLHRTDEPLGSIYETLERMDTGHAVGAITEQTTRTLAAGLVAEYLRELGNDGEFFAEDLVEDLPQWTTDVCRHCGHGIREENGTWIAPDAGFDRENGDGIWRDSCPDNHESREAPHEPEPASDAGLEDDLRLIRKFDPEEQR